MNSRISQSAYYREWAFVYGRKFLLTILALGSVLVTHKIGMYFAALLAPHSFFFSLIIKTGFVALGWAGIDWVLANALAEASSIHPDEETHNNRPVWVFAICALVTTLLLSIASNQFISNELAGETHLDDFNAQVSKAMTQDSVLKSHAFYSLQNATKEQQSLVQSALKEKGRLVAAAVSKGTQSWKKDYYSHKNKPKAYFWTCGKCPQGYKNYRQSILDATKQGDQLIYEAKNHKKFVQQSLSPTLSYELAKDTLLATVNNNTLKLEQERKFRERQLNTILLVMTVGCGILALILTYVLKTLRKKYGQQVVENNVQFIMVLFDMCGRFGNGLADIIYTVFVHPFNALKKRGWIKSYALSSNRMTVYPPNGFLKTTQTVKRVCLNCKTDITHKRKQAKYCSDKCRMDYHKFIPHKKKPLNNRN